MKSLNTLAVIAILGTGLAFPSMAVNQKGTVWVSKAKLRAFAYAHPETKAQPGGKHNQYNDIRSFLRKITLASVKTRPF